MKLDKKPFVEQAINTRCRAFRNHIWFGTTGDNVVKDGLMGQEFYPELSCKKAPPEPEINGVYDSDIQGTMCFMDMDGGMANLYLACNYYNEIGEDYFVFWDCRDADHENGITQWVIWLPNVDYPN